MERDWQKVLVALLTVLAGLALLWVIWQVISPIQHTLILFGLAAVLAFALSGPVNMLSVRIDSRLVCCWCVAALRVRKSSLSPSGVGVQVVPHFLHHDGLLVCGLAGVSNGLATANDPTQLVWQTFSNINTVRIIYYFN